MSSILLLFDNCTIFICYSSLHWASWIFQCHSEMTIILWLNIMQYYTKWRIKLNYFWPFAIVFTQSGAIRFNFFSLLLLDFAHSTVTNPQFIVILHIWKWFGLLTNFNTFTIWRVMVIFLFLDAPCIYTQWEKMFKIKFNSILK